MSSYQEYKKARGKTFLFFPIALSLVKTVVASYTQNFQLTVVERFQRDIILLKCA